MNVSVNPQPRVRFCWSCGLKLRGNHFVEAVVERHPRIMHKACAKAIRMGQQIHTLDDPESNNENGAQK